MFKWVIVILPLLFISVTAKDFKKNSIRECSYRLDKNVTKNNVKNLYYAFAKTILTRDAELIADLFDSQFYPTAFRIPGHSMIDSRNLASHFSKFNKIGDKELIRLSRNKMLDNDENFFIHIYLILLSRYDWMCGSDKSFKSIYFSIKHRENCRIEVDRGESDNFRYMLKIFYKKDVYDISFTKDNKIKGIQCTNFSEEGY